MSDFEFTVTDGIGLATFNRPQARNALTFEMYEGLAATCAEVTSDVSRGSQNCRAIVVTGDAKAFAAGTDIAQFRAFESGADGIAYERQMGHVFDRVERCPVPVVAAISGACTGGGAAIAAVCDIRIASDNMRFGFPIARTLGNTLSPENLARTADLVGLSRAKKLLMTATLIDAREALDCGLIAEVCADHDATLERALSLAAKMAAMAPLTISSVKETYRRLTHAAAAVDCDDLIEQCYGSDDFREGMDAFLAKRHPVWRGT